VLCPVKILASELTQPDGEPFIKPSLFQPPGIEPERMRAGHAARAGQQSKLPIEVTSALPERSRVKIPSGLTYQRTEIDVDRASESVPTDKALVAIALDVREIIADVLQIEPDASFEQIWPDTAPVSQEMAVRTLTCLMTVRAAKRFL
jgi:hypothetical protein